jgi:hypothetical protein
MPPNYSKSKLYRLFDDKGFFYYGTTVESLAIRKAKHKYDSKSHTEQKVYKQFNNNWDNVKIELVKSCPCESKEELHTIENDAIRLEKTNPLCLNTTMPLFDINDYREYLKKKYSS